MAQKSNKKGKAFFEKLVPKDESGSDVLSLISYGMKSKAQTVIIPFQDYLELDSDERMNTPGTPTNNWEWRFEKDALNRKVANKIIRLTNLRNAPI